MELRGKKGGVSSRELHNMDLETPLESLPTYYRWIVFFYSQVVMWHGNSMQLLFVVKLKKTS